MDREELLTVESPRKITASITEEYGDRHWKRVPYSVAPASDRFICSVKCVSGMVNVSN